MAKFVEANGTMQLIDDKLEYVLRSLIISAEAQVRRSFPELRDHAVRKATKGLIKGYLKQMED